MNPVFIDVSIYSLRITVFEHVLQMTDSHWTFSIVKINSKSINIAVFCLCSPVIVSVSNNNNQWPHAYVYVLNSWNKKVHLKTTCLQNIFDTHNESFSSFSSFSFMDSTYHKHFLLHPLYNLYYVRGGRVVKAFDCGARGCGFDPGRRHLFRDIISGLNFPMWRHGLSVKVRKENQNSPSERL